MAKHWCPYNTAEGDRPWVLREHGNGRSTLILLRDNSRRIVHFANEQAARKRATELNNPLPDCLPSNGRINKDLFPNKVRKADKLTRNELLVLVDEMATDFQMVNTIYNGRARANHWCWEYEMRQNQYNIRLKVLKLLHRSENGGGAAPGL